MKHIVLQFCFDILSTSNVTSVTEVRNASACLPVRGAPDECYYNTLLCCDNFLSSSVVSRVLSALCVCSKFGHHPHPLGYLCAKLTMEKIAYSITHSLAHSITHQCSLFDAPGTEALALLKEHKVNEEVCLYKQKTR